MFAVCSLNFIFFRVCGLESVPHRVSLDIQLRHAHWKVTENDDMEGMHLSPPPPILLELMVIFSVTISKFTEC